ncbi:sensor histidine kinase [Paenibacillus sp. 1P07SE]|uniref:sensor histidine kinase n=1 Tax=Paenibacillus sp. 1P07SE TaxID=3132209 RepID=UPI0039A4C101
MKTLYRQFILATLCILAISIIGGFFLANQYYLRVTKERSDEQNVAIAQEIVSAMEQNHQSETGFDVYLQSVARLGYQIYVRSQDGEEHIFGEAFEGRTLPPEAMRVITDQSIYHGIQNYAGGNFIFGHFSNDLKNTVGVPFTYNNQRYGLFVRPNIRWLSSDIHTVFVGFILAIAIVNIAGMLWLARQLTRPIVQLTEATRQIARENYSYQPDIQRKDEIGQLSDSFNLMQLQLQHNLLARKAFVSNVSHDFQSPLMNIQGYAGLLQTSSVSEEKRVEYAAIIDQEARRLSALTMQLLLLSSLEQTHYPLNLSEFRLDEQLKTVIRRYRWRLEESEIDLSYKLAPLSIHADEELLMNVWDNLLTNAIKYNRPAGSIEISMRTDSSGVSVTFRDTGIGIAPASLPHVFERFFREDEARKNNGTGLGLSIAREIITLHNGNIQVQSKKGEGSIFTISFPQNMIF